MCFCTPSIRTPCCGSDACHRNVHRGLRGYVTPEQCRWCASEFILARTDAAVASPKALGNPCAHKVRVDYVDGIDGGPGCWMCSQCDAVFWPGNSAALAAAVAEDVEDKVAALTSRLSAAEGRAVKAEARRARREARLRKLWQAYRAKCVLIDHLVPKLIALHDCQLSGLAAELATVREAYARQAAQFHTALETVGTVAVDARTATIEGIADSIGGLRTRICSGCVVKVRNQLYEMRDVDVTWNATEKRWEAKS